MAFGQEYSSNHVYFIAGGKTLEIIRQYENDCQKENIAAAKQAIMKDYGAEQIIGIVPYSYFSYSAPCDHPAMELKETGSKRFFYTANPATEEGRALQARLRDIPEHDMQSAFARRLTGAVKTETNPDDLRTENHHQFYLSECVERAASFDKYGDTYVVKVPRVLRAVFNAASDRESLEFDHPMAAGYTYDWFTPPGCTQIPYSKVVEMQEQEKGDQLSPRVVTQLTPIIPRGR